MSDELAATPTADAPADDAPALGTKPVSAKSAVPADATDMVEAAPYVEDRGKVEEVGAGAGGVFSGWGFDVNAVAGNIGGLFAAAPDDVAAEDASVKKGVDREQEKGEDIGATAAHLATAATTELEHASKAAQKTIGKAAQELGKGWGTFNTFLDDMLAAKPEGEGANVGDLNASFRAIFPELAEDDEVVDHFQCALLQKYRCYLNNSTPEKTYALRGRMYVSTLHVAMHIMEDGGAFGGKPFGISVPFQDVGKIQKGAKSMLRLVTKSQSSYIFADFESDSHFTGALGLLEHMTSAAAPPPEPALEGEEVRKVVAETG